MAARRESESTSPRGRCSSPKHSKESTSLRSGVKCNTSHRDSTKSRWCTATTTTQTRTSEATTRTAWKCLITLFEKFLLMASWIEQSLLAIFMKLIIANLGKVEGDRFPSSALQTNSSGCNVLLLTLSLEMNSRWLWN